METTFVWFTGLSGSGKSTIAGLLHTQLVNRGKKVTIVDGDVVREKFHHHLGFSPADIKQNNALIVQYCQQLQDQFDFVLITVIAPFEESRALTRQKLSPHYVEVYVKADFETCEKRDVKGLYKKAKQGEIDNFIGLHIPYEVPVSPDLVLDTEAFSIDACVNLCLLKLIPDHSS